MTRRGIYDHAVTWDDRDAARKAGTTVTVLDRLTTSGHLSPTGAAGRWTRSDVDHLTRVIAWLHAGMPIAAAVAAAHADRPTP